MQTKEWTFKSQDGLELYARYWAPDKKAKAVACLVHGLGEHTGRYHNVADAMTAAGYALMGFDLRGHGRSEAPPGPYSMDQHADDVAALLDALRPVLTAPGYQPFPPCW